MTDGAEFAKPRTVFYYSAQLGEPNLAAELARDWYPTGLLSQSISEYCSHVLGAGHGEHDRFDL